MADRYPGLQAIVFDLDGTLIDSLPDIAAATNVALGQIGLTTLTAEAVAGMVGNGSEVLITRALTAVLQRDPSLDLVADVHATFLAAYDRGACVLTRLYPGASEALDAFRTDGIRLGICTNKPQDITASVLGHLGIADLFDSIVGGSAAAPLKPAPDMLLRALRELDAPPGASVMVGDSRADAGTAHAAGTHLVLLQHGYSRDDLHSLGADAVLPGFAGLPDALAGMTWPAR